MSEKMRYGLYALKVNAENMELASRQRFNRITPGYILIYTADGAPENSVGVCGEDIHRLGSGDTGWLFDCNIALITEEAAKQAQAIAQELDDKMSGFEAALEEERARLEGGREIAAE